MEADHASVPTQQIMQEKYDLRYEECGHETFRFSVAMFMHVFGFSETELRACAGVLDVRHDDETEAVWLTLDTTKVVEPRLALLYPWRQPFFYKFIRGECCYGFGHEPTSYNHKIRKILYIFRFVLHTP